jgi:hypothetical protein
MRLRTLARLARMPFHDKAITVEALALLAAASLAIARRPFREVVELAAGHATAQPRYSDAQTIDLCRWAVKAWADRVPWRAVCFQRGLALHWMLRRRGILSLLNYGVAQGGDKGLRAHVWVDVGGRTVMGGAEAPGFACLATFPDHGGV